MTKAWNIRRLLETQDYNKNTEDDDIAAIVGNTNLEFDIVKIPLERLVEYRDESLYKEIGIPQPFRPYNEEDMQALTESIYQHGVLNPIIVNPIQDERYQIVAGHNRVCAARKAGMSVIPAIVRQMDAKTAALIMIETNLRQRKYLLFSELAYAYRMRRDLLTCQGRRTDLADAGKTDTLSEIAAMEHVSRRKVSYLIRLSYLKKELLDLIDAKKMTVKVGVELSYLSEEHQAYVFENIIPYHKLKNLHAQQLKELELDGQACPETMQEVFLKEQKPPSSITIRGKVLAPYASVLREKKQEELEELFLKFLGSYFSEKLG